LRQSQQFSKEQVLQKNKDCVWPHPKFQSA
jgi:hypothetical protein